MAQPYLGEIRMFAGSFAPAGWAFCAGQLMPISENSALFNLIGTTYGGDGQSTFGLPDLQGRLPLHQGNGFIQGETGGVEEVTLTSQQIPVHNHAMLASSGQATSNSPNGNVLAATQAATVTAYGTDGPFVQLAPQAIGIAGGNQPHTNMQPYLCITYIISLFGIFPHT
jgi:microcystin-dependent protein